jgi:hypothetical protein
MHFWNVTFNISLKVFFLFLMGGILIGFLVLVMVVLGHAISGLALVTAIIKSRLATDR